jgi:hypothetical protein
VVVEGSSHPQLVQKKEVQMADSKERELNQAGPDDAEQALEQRASDESGRDPTARRGEIEEGGSLSDAEVGEDEIEKKAVGGYGADTGEAARQAPPLTDKSSQR